MRVPGTIQIALAPDGPSSGVTPSAAPAASSAPASGGGTVSSSAPPTSTATPSPTAAPPASAEDASGIDSFNFDTIFEPAEGGQSSVPVEAPVVQPPVPEVAPVAAQPQPASAQPEVQPAPVPPAVPGQGPQDGREAAVSPPLNPAEPASLANALRVHEAAAIAQLASTEFALSPEEVEALEGDAVSAIPKLMAKAYVKAQHTMLLHLARSVPLMIQRHLEVTKKNTESVDKFYGKWTNLKPSVHGDLVNRIAQSYRGANPGATMDQMIEDVGVMVSQLAKVALPASVPAGPGNGVRPPQSPPFQPAMGGPVVSSSQVEENPWDILGRTE